MHAGKDLTQNPSAGSPTTSPQHPTLLLLGSAHAAVIYSSVGQRESWRVLDLAFSPEEHISRSETLNKKAPRHTLVRLIVQALFVYTM